MIDIQGGVSYEPRTRTLSGVSQQPFSAHFLILLHPKNQSVYQKCRSAVPSVPCVHPCGWCHLISHSLVLWPFDGIVFHKSATSTGSGALAGAVVRRVSVLTASLPLS